MKKTRAPNFVKKTLIRYFRGELRQSPSSLKGKAPHSLRWKFLNNIKLLKA